MIWSMKYVRAVLDSTIFVYNCCMQLMLTCHVSSKSDVQHRHDSCTQHENCCRILKLVLR